MVSDGCRKHKIYDKYFNKICPSVEIIYPDEHHQKLVTQGICNVKNSHRFDSKNSKNRPQNIFKKVAKHLFDYYVGGGEIIVIAGCTDIRVDYYDPNGIDSLEVLKNAIYKEIKDE